jgi:hypothetical protein
VHGQQAALAIMGSDMTNHKRQRPAWLLGLIIASVLFIIGVVVFQALGFGDNPVLESALSGPDTLSIVGL